MAFEKTYDAFIRSNVWNGRQKTLRTRMAEYLVDGRRLGSIVWPTQSGSESDSTLDKSSREILAAALTLSHLEYKDVAIRSVDESGVALERPDLDATVDGMEIGIEVADVPGTPKHDAMKNRIEVRITDLLNTDPAFRRFFGNHYFEINLNPIGRWEHVPLDGNKEADAVLEEIIAFVRCGLKPSDAHLQPFPVKYPVLHGRGSEYHLSALPSDAYFSVSDGPSISTNEHRYEDVIAVLDKHRKSAEKGYRALREIWIVLFLPDGDEYFRGTAEIVASRAPAIAPFKRLYVTDTAGSVARISQE